MIYAWLFCEPREGTRSSRVPIAWIPLHQVDPWGTEGTLGFRRESCWFPGFDVPIAHREAKDIPTQDRGVTLSLSGADADRERLEMSLTLASSHRDIYREIDHRVSGELPFLFTFLVHGDQVRLGRTSRGFWTGARVVVRIVRAGDTRTWRFLIEGSSISEVVPRSAHEISLVAAFSERQYYPLGLAEQWSEFPPDISGRDLKNDSSGPLNAVTLVRSNELRLWKREGKWQVAK